MFVLLCISLSLNGYFYTTRPKLPTVTSVIDGDTVMLSNGDRVRLLGANAPEKGRCMATESATKLSEYVLHKPVRIEEEKHDTYNRRMGLVFVGNMLVNTSMIREGYAKPNYDKNSRSQEFIAAYNEAKAGKKGVNSAVCKKSADTAPPDPNCVIKGNIDSATGDKLYHVPACRHYNQIVMDLDAGEAYFCTEQEASRAGFILAPDCLR